MFIILYILVLLFHVIKMYGSLVENAALEDYRFTFIKRFLSRGWMEKGDVTICEE